MRKKYWDSPFIGLAAIFLIVAAVVGIALAAGDETKPKQIAQSTTPCGHYRKDVSVKINQHTFNTELAKTSQEFAKGLGGRTCILDNQAMLFSFRQSGHYAFWMKDMKFPIDIVWIGSDHRVAGLEIDVKPSTYPDKFINRDNLAQYVLEIKGNLSKDLHIDLGTPVTF